MANSKADFTNSLVRVVADCPGWWVFILSAGAWAMLIAREPMTRMLPLCLPTSINPAVRLVEDFKVAWQTGAICDALTGWFVMSLAMMPPLAVGLIRHVSIRTFAARRGRAIVEFIAAGLIPWFIVGVVALPLLISASMWVQSRSLTATVGFVIAALWQLTPMKSFALRRCHRTFPLAPAGWQADRDCLRYGFVHGTYCVGSCWAMMLAAMLAAPAWLAMLLMQTIALEERRERAPSVRAYAGALLLCSAISAVAASS
jgi:predicted metal-binding membrane protein